MKYYITLLLLIHYATTAVTGRERRNEEIAKVGVEARSVGGEGPEVGVVAHEIVPRVQDPTDHLICRLVKMSAPHLLVVPTMRFSGLRQYLFSPAEYATLCVSPEKPKPFPVLFSPPAPLTPSVSSAPPAPLLEPHVIKGPGSRPASALGAPAPAISLVFSTPVGSIGIGAPSSPAVNIESQSITDIADKPTLLIRGVGLRLPFT